MTKTVTKIISMITAGLLMAVVLMLPCGQAVAEEATENPNLSASGISPETAAEYVSKRELNKHYKWKDYECYKEAKGNQTYCIRSQDISGNKVNEGARLYTKGSKRAGCEVVSVAWSNNKDCTFCSLLSVAYQASDILTVKALKTFASSFQVLIVIIFAIWLGIRTLNHVSFLTSQDAAKYITDILLQAFKFLLAYFALNYYEDGTGLHWYIFDLLVKPIFEGGLDFAIGFVNSNGGEDSFNVVDHFKGYIDTKSVLNNKLYDSAIYERLEAFSRYVNEQFSLLQTIGRVLRCLGGKYLTLFNVKENGIQFGLGFNCLIYGLLFGVLGFLLSLAFVFYLFDAVVELGIFGAILPFAIACWPFKLFTKASTNAIKLFLNSTFTFMMAGVAVNVCVQLISHALGSTNSGGNAGISALVQAVDTLDVDAMQELLSVISLGFLVFAFAGFGGFLMVGKVASLTNTFAGGGLSPQASSIATMGASAITGGAKKITKPTTEAIGKKINDKSKEVLGQVANSKVGKFVGKSAGIAGALAITGPAGAVVAGAIGAHKIVKAVRRKRNSKN